MSDESSAPTKSASRKIPGGLPYTTSPGVLSRVLERIPASEKPSVFNTDFISTVLGAAGGASRQVPPILKGVGLISQSGTPTELYSQFQTESGRAAAAIQALKNGFSEIFRRNQYAHKADEGGLVDIIVSVTGLPKSDPVVRYIKNTFNVFKGFTQGARDETVTPTEPDTKTTTQENADPSNDIAPKSMQLAYNINIILPETTNIEVYNSIFKSLNSNLMK